jgi:hypothetical protein
MDKQVLKSSDDWSLRVPDYRDFWGGLRGELIYDHTRMLGRNLPLGARSKLFFEFYQGFTNEFLELYIGGNPPEPSLKSTNLFVIGADYRHYMRIWRTCIWANRVAGSTSFGQSKLLYYMGGVDDWLLPKFNSNIVVDPKQNYAYQTLATSMRGFNQNIRNGNTFVVASSELRFPIMSCLFSRPIGGQWLQNLQLIGFVDAGSAWVGYNPWNKNNAIYNQIEDLGSEDGLRIVLEKDLSPFVAGMGFGFRTQLAGYFIRIDRANGFENGFFQRRIWHFSFGFDF